MSLCFSDTCALPLFTCIILSFFIPEKYAQIQQNPVLPPAPFFLWCKNSKEVSFPPPSPLELYFLWSCDAEYIYTDVDAAHLCCSPPVQSWHLPAVCSAGTVSQPVTCCRWGRWWSTFTRRSSTWTTSLRPPAPQPTISPGSRRRRRTWPCWPRKRSN